MRTGTRNVPLQYPEIEPYIDDIIPKKGEIMEGKGYVGTASYLIDASVLQAMHVAARTSLVLLLRKGRLHILNNEMVPFFPY
jgi:hypothetical protein